MANPLKYEDLSKFRDPPFTASRISRLASIGETGDGEPSLSPLMVTSIVTRVRRRYENPLFSGSIIKREDELTALDPKVDMIGRKRVRGYSLEQLFYFAVIDLLKYHNVPYAQGAEVCEHLSRGDFLKMFFKEELECAWLAFAAAGLPPTGHGGSSILWFRSEDELYAQVRNEIHRFFEAVVRNDQTARPNDGSRAESIRIYKLSRAFWQTAQRLKDET